MTRLLAYCPAEEGPAGISSADEPRWSSCASHRPAHRLIEVGRRDTTEQARRPDHGLHPPGSREGDGGVVGQADPSVESITVHSFEFGFIDAAVAALTR